MILNLLDPWTIIVESDQNILICFSKRLNIVFEKKKLYINRDGNSGKYLLNIGSRRMSELLSTIQPPIDVE